MQYLSSFFLSSNSCRCKILRTLKGYIINVIKYLSSFFLTVVSRFQGFIELFAPGG